MIEKSLLQIFFLLQTYFSFKVPGKVQNLQQIRLKNNNIELTWDAPFARGNDIITYLVMYGGSTKKTKERKFMIESDTQDQTYNVTVLGNYFQTLKAKY